ncbi:hypothetical protein ABKN59_006294 [Abortiporus biennis]
MPCNLSTSGLFFQISILAAWLTTFGKLHGWIMDWKDSVKNNSPPDGVFDWTWPCSTIPGTGTIFERPFGFYGQSVIFIFWAHLSLDFFPRTATGKGIKTV